MPTLSIIRKAHLLFIAIFYLGIPLLLTSGGEERESGDLIPIRFAPHWVPQAQFAGFYLAKDRGYYREEELDVTILQGGPEHPATRKLKTGEAEVATLFLSQGIEMRSEGVPVILVAQLLQESSLLLISKKKSGIESPEDLDGRKISIWPDFIAQPEAMFRKFSVEPEIIELGSTVGILQWRGVEAISAMRYNEYVQLYLMGYEPEELSLIEFKDYEIGFPEDGIYVMEDFFQENREAVRGFVRASLRGWASALEDPEAALDSVMKRIYQAGLSTNRAHQKRMLASLRPLYESILESEEGTRLKRLDFDRVSEVLLRFGQLQAIPVWEEFYPDGK